MKIPILVILLICVSIRSIEKIEDPDIWFHIKQGESIVERGELTPFDPFSYTATEKRWVTDEWLSQVIFYLVVAWGGILGLILFKGALLALTFFFLYSAGIRRSASPIILGLIFLLVMKVSHPGWVVRPHVISYLMVAITNYVLVQWEEKKAGSTLLWLLPIGLLWVNLHGSFVLIFILLGVRIFAELLKKAAKNGTGDIVGEKESQDSFLTFLVVFVILIFICFINPQGIHAFVYPYEFATNKFYTGVIQEWMPPNLLQNKVQNRDFLFLFVLLWGGLLLAGRKGRVEDFLYSAAFTYLSFNAVRHIPLFSLAIYPVLAEYVSKVANEVANGVSSLLNKDKPLNQWGKVASHRLFSYVSPIFFAGFAILSGFLLFQKWGGREFGFGIQKNVFPKGAMEFAKKNKIHGNIFNPYAWGGHLLWFYPEYKVFVDGRTLFYGEEILRQYQDVCAMTPKGAYSLEKYSVNFILVEYTSTHSQGLRRFLCDSLGWKLIFWDDTALLYVRNVEKNKEILEKFSFDAVRPLSKDGFKKRMGKLALLESFKAIKEFGPAGVHYAGLALIFSGEGNFVEAIKYGKMAIDLNPTLVEVHHTVGFALYEMGKKESAFAEFKKCDLYSRDFSAVFVSLGRYYLEKGDFNKAIKEFEKALEVEKDIYERAPIYYNIGLAYARGNMHERAIPFYERAIGILPDFVSAHINLGISFYQVGRKNDASFEFRAALKLDPGNHLAKDNLRKVESR